MHCSDFSSIALSPSAASAPSPPPPDGVGVSAQKGFSFLCVPLLSCLTFLLQPMVVVPWRSLAWTDRAGMKRTQHCHTLLKTAKQQAGSCCTDGARGERESSPHPELRQTPKDDQIHVQLSLKCTFICVLEFKTSTATMINRERNSSAERNPHIIRVDADIVK
jgi:hypothetical protein